MFGKRDLDNKHTQGLTKDGKVGEVYSGSNRIQFNQPDEQLMKQFHADYNYENFTIDDMMVEYKLYPIIMELRRQMFD